MGDDDIVETCYTCRFGDTGDAVRVTIVGARAILYPPTSTSPEGETKSVDCPPSVSMKVHIESARGMERHA